MGASSSGEESLMSEAARVRCEQRCQSKAARTLASAELAEENAQRSVVEGGILNGIFDR
jgi:hypothetical protein